MDVGVPNRKRRQRVLPSDQIMNSSENHFLPARDWTLNHEHWIDRWIFEVLEQSIASAWTMRCCRSRSGQDEKNAPGLFRNQ